MPKLKSNSKLFNELRKQADQQSARAGFKPAFGSEYELVTDNIVTCPNIKDKDNKPVKLIALNCDGAEIKVRLSALTQVCRNADNTDWVDTQSIEEIMTILSNHDKFTFEQAEDGLFLGKKLDKELDDEPCFTANSGQVYKLVSRPIWKIKGL